MKGGGAILSDRDIDRINIKWKYKIFLAHFKLFASGSPELSNLMQVCKCSTFLFNVKYVYLRYIISSKSSLDQFDFV